MQNLKNQIITLDLKNSASNTYIVHDVNLENNMAYLKHPLNEEILISKPLNELNTCSSRTKDSTERGLDLIKDNLDLLDYHTIGDFEGLCLIFILRRRLTLRQKNTLSAICGNIAQIRFDDNIQEAMRYITFNSALLDDFNLMWYNNFKNLFKGTQQITSKKQIKSIFNMTGFILAELHTPRVNK